MIFVCSTRMNTSSCAHARTAYRAATTSASERTGAVSLRSSAMAVLLHAGVQRRAKQLHASLNIQSGPYAGQREAQLHQRDRYRRLHPDDHRFGIEDV